MTNVALRVCNQAKQKKMKLTIPNLKLKDRTRLLKPAKRELRRLLVVERKFLLIQMFRRLLTRVTAMSKQRLHSNGQETVSKKLSTFSKSVTNTRFARTRMIMNPENLTRINEKAEKEPTLSHKALNPLVPFLCLIIWRTKFQRRVKMPSNPRTTLIALKITYHRVSGRPTRTFLPEENSLKTGHRMSTSLVTIIRHLQATSILGIATMVETKTEILRITATREVQEISVVVMDRETLEMLREIQEILEMVQEVIVIVMKTTTKEIPSTTLITRKVTSVP